MIVTILTFTLVIIPFLFAFSNVWNLTATQISAVTTFLGYLYEWNGLLPVYTLINTIITIAVVAILIILFKFALMIIGWITG